jgi:NTE family protein
MSRVGLVLAGGAAHGAYEVGVIRHIVTDVARDLGRPIRFDVLCGTSVGAINACAMAAAADEPAAGAARLAEAWGSLRLSDLLRPSPLGILAMAASLRGGSARRARRAGLFAQTSLRRLLSRFIDFRRIRHNVRAKHLTALAVSATHIASGRTVSFVEQENPVLWGSLGPDAIARPTRIRVDHTVASCAVPVLFPAAEIDGQLYCDGGLRQMLPLAPALRLGADALVVVNPRATPEDEPETIQRDRERAYGSPIFLVGRILDVLLVDRVRDDLDRLRQVNALLDAGTRRFGAGFVAGLGQELRAAGHAAVRPVATVEIRTSQDVGRLAADFVRSPDFVAHAGFPYGRLFRILADAESTRETTFLSYLLFDGRFARELMELGRADARAQHTELCAVLSTFEPAARRLDRPVA